MKQQNGDTLCCVQFDPAPWQEKEIIWKDKLFVKETMPQFMHIPLPGTFGKAVARMWGKIESAGAKPDLKDFIMLAAESSPWRGEVYINSLKEIQNAENVRFSGTYLTRVFDGPFGSEPKWIKEMAPYAAQKGKKVKNYYFYYPTCPKCAKVYGHNYVVVFAEV